MKINTDHCLQQPPEEDPGNGRIAVSAFPLRVSSTPASAFTTRTMNH